MKKRSLESENPANRCVFVTAKAEIVVKKLTNAHPLTILKPLLFTKPEHAFFIS